jgi:hypothetical protein
VYPLYFSKGRTRIVGIRLLTEHTEAGMEGKVIEYRIGDLIMVASKDAREVSREGFNPNPTARVELISGTIVLLNRPLLGDLYWDISGLRNLSAEYVVTAEATVMDGGGYRSRIHRKTRELRRANGFVYLGQTVHRAPLGAKEEGREVLEGERPGFHYHN